MEARTARMSVLPLGGDSRWDPEMIGMVEKFALGVGGRSVKDCNRWLAEERDGGTVALISLHAQQPSRHRRRDIADCGLQVRKLHRAFSNVSKGGHLEQFFIQIPDDGINHTPNASDGDRITDGGRHPGKQTESPVHLKRGSR